jgi:hypothetical protein
VLKKVLDVAAFIGITLLAVEIHRSPDEFTLWITSLILVCTGITMLTRDIREWR